MVIPINEENADKAIVDQGYVRIRNIRYYMRKFDDGSAELVRFDESAKKWVFLMFERN